VFIHTHVEPAQHGHGAEILGDVFNFKKCHV
jgi:hypothetical protein